MRERQAHVQGVGFVHTQSVQNVKRVQKHFLFINFFSFKGFLTFGSIQKIFK